MSLVRTLKIATICVFGCTGSYGRHVAGLIAQYKDPSTVLLLAGRNLARIRDICGHLISPTVRIHPEPVAVENDEALRILASSARLLVNCVKVSSATATIVAQACLDAPTHYMDLAHTLSLLLPVFAMPTSRSLLVPACGLDYALFDVAIVRATQPGVTHLQLVMALRPGPLDIRWTTRSVEQILFESHSSTRPGHMTTSQLSRPKVPLLSYARRLKTWTIPWFMARDALDFLVHQREEPVALDIRIAVPLWRGLVFMLHGIILVLTLLPFLFLARYNLVI
jgi:hypothetical protein